MVSPSSSEDRLRRGAVVVAGGASTRMGTSKAWLSVDGTSLLEHVVEVLQQLDLVVVVVGVPDRLLPKLAQGVVRVDDEEPFRGQGPLAGVAAGLAALAGKGVAMSVLTSCDAALLDRAHIEWLFARLMDQPNCDAVVPRSTDGRFDVLASVVRVDVARARAKALLTAGRRSLQAFAGELRVDAVAVDELPCPDVVMPCNTPEQWRAVIARMKARRLRP